jgi:hypothetical protein
VINILLQYETCESWGSIHTSQHKIWEKWVSMFKVCAWKVRGMRKVFEKGHTLYAEGKRIYKSIVLKCYDEGEGTVFFSGK